MSHFAIKYDMVNGSQLTACKKRIKRYPGDDEVKLHTHLQQFLNDPEACEECLCSKAIENRILAEDMRGRS